MFPSIHLHFALVLAMLAGIPERKDPEIRPENLEIAEGYYLCNGKIADKEYEGIVVIRKHGDSYILQWVIGLEAYFGVGMRDGDRLVVGWSSSAGKGVTVYQVGSKKLVGTWVAIPGNGKVHEETLELLKPIKKPHSE